MECRKSGITTWWVSTVEASSSPGLLACSKVKQIRENEERVSRRGAEEKREESSFDRSIASKSLASNFSAHFFGKCYLLRQLLLRLASTPFCGGSCQASNPALRRLLWKMTVRRTTTTVTKPIEETLILPRRYLLTNCVCRRMQACCPLPLPKGHGAP